MKRLLDWATEAAQWIVLIAGFAIFWFLIVPELDARFGFWWFPVALAPVVLLGIYLDGQR